MKTFLFRQVILDQDIYVVIWPKKSQSNLVLNFQIATGELMKITTGSEKTKT